MNSGLKFCLVLFAFSRDGYRRNGECDRWLSEASRSTKRLSKTVNGPMLEFLAKEVGCEDLDRANFFRKGAPVFDGNGEFAVDKCEESNRALLKNLRPDPNECELHALTMADADLGRMTVPVEADKVDLSKVRLVPRFAVEQGVKPNGEVKIRAVDNFSWSAAPAGQKRRLKGDVKVASINGHYQVPCELTHDHIDDLHAAMALHYHMFDEACGVLA